MPQPDDSTEKAESSVLTSCLPKGPTPGESAVAGAAGGICSVMLTYPIHKVMFRVMQTDISTDKSIKEIRYEGLRTLFRGMGPPVFSKGINSAVMFGSNNGYKDLLHNHLPALGPETVVFLAAFLSGSTEAIHGIPLERVQTLLMDKRYNSKKELNTTFKAFSHIRTTYGYKELYRGGSAIWLRNSVGCSMYFGGIKKMDKLLESESDLSKFTKGFLVGGIIGGFSSSSYFPLNVIKTQMQSEMGGRYPSMWEVAKSIFKKHGSLTRFYSGVHLNLFRSCIGWGITTVTAQYLEEQFQLQRCKK